MATDLAAYIRQAAIARGIDPEIALRVARSEGGLKDPTRQSDVMRNGSREPSYGPFQLLVGGENGFPAGLGNDALAKGIDPRTPDGALRGIDFALDTAKQRGWGPWYGAKAAGITGNMGIGGLAPSSATASQQSSGPIVPGTMAPPIGPGQNIADHPIAAIQPSAPPPAVASVAQGAGRVADILGSMAPMAPSKPQFQPVEIRGPSQQQATALTSFIEALKKRVPQYG